MTGPRRTAIQRLVLLVLFFSNLQPVFAATEKQGPSVSQERRLAGAIGENALFDAAPRSLEADLLDVETAAPEVRDFLKAQPPDSLERLTLAVRALPADFRAEAEATPGARVRTLQMLGGLIVDVPAGPRGDAYITENLAHLLDGSQTIASDGSVAPVASDRVVDDIAQRLGLPDVPREILLQRAYAMPGYRSEEHVPQARSVAAAFRALKERGIRFAIGGTFGLEHLTGLGRPTENIDIYVLGRDAKRAEEALEWLQSDKDMHLLEFRDTGTGNRYAEISDGFKIKIVRFIDEHRTPVDTELLKSARPGSLFGEEVSFMAPEDMIWSKAHVIRRPRFEGHDIGYILHQQMSTIDWERLLGRFKKDWELLDLQLILYQYAYPGAAPRVPRWVQEELGKRVLAKYGSGNNAKAKKLKVAYGPMLKSNFDIERMTPNVARKAYAELLSILNDAKVPFLVGGTYALSFYAKAGRPTKDFDVFIRQSDLPAALKALEERGYETEIPFPHWLAKAHNGDFFTDLIYNSGNGMMPVDDVWFGHSHRGTLFGVPVRYAPLEQIMWTKTTIMEREHFDGFDFQYLLMASEFNRKLLDWRHLMSIFENRDWEMLYFHLKLFRYLHPDLAKLVPKSAWKQLERRWNKTYRDGETDTGDRVMRLTILSRASSIAPKQAWGYEDARLEGAMTEDDIELWTRAILERK